METLLSNPTGFWLGLGAFLIVLEAITMPGLGLFLAGIAALCTGLLVKAGIVDEGALGAQVAWFFGHDDVLGGGAVETASEVPHETGAQGRHRAQ